ncbi:MAG: NAD-dependent epimerase/dehydratase family protein [Myxococcales bacterium]|nr:NAD-dependent epimerase/dehydratase family protein [Myxococcales bacterium]
MNTPGDAHADAPDEPSSGRGRVLVTGADNLIGANLIRRLLDAGEQLRVLVRGDSGRAATRGLELERVHGDLRDRAAAAEAVRGCARVYHCARARADFGRAARSRRELFEDNVVGTRAILEAAAEAGVEKVVVTGSLAAVGRERSDPTLPAREDALYDPLEQVSPYEASMALRESECWRAAAAGLPVTVAVACTVIGPHDYEPSLVGRALQEYASGRVRVYSSGGCEFVAARDIVDGHLRCMSAGRSGHKYLFSSEFLSVDDLMDMFEAVTGVPRPRARLPAPLLGGLSRIGALVGRAPVFSAGVLRQLRMRRRVDTRKAREELGYAPSSLHEAVREAFEDLVRRGLLERRGARAPTSHARDADASRRHAP